jgi:glycosyltransferase involved in cell wall biosynthesis
MAGVKKMTIVIASVLKPVNDTRMFEKIGQTLAGTTQFDVHIIGFPAPLDPIPSLHVHRLSPFKRLGFKRLFIPWTILRMSLKLRPDLMIITTHELIFAALVVKLFRGSKIVYDVQENYYRNIKYTGAFPLLVRPFVAGYVRIKESLSSIFIDHFFLAEIAYATELKFTAQRGTVLENKLKIPVEKTIVKRNNREKYQLLFSGTLSESTGVFTAIEIAIKLHALDKNIRLRIVGYCSQPDVLQKIKTTIEPYTYIGLIGGDQLVPHAEIIEHIQQADAGIIAYPFNPSTYSATPTKLYEYLGYQLPIVLIDHPQWVERCAAFQAAVVFDPDRINPKKLWESLNSQSFYPIVPADVFWESEQPKLLDRVHKILGTLK